MVTPPVDMQAISLGLFGPHIPRERVQQSIRSLFNPIGSLKPGLLAAYLDSFRFGFFRNIALAWDLIEKRDYALSESSTFSLT